MAHTLKPLTPSAPKAPRSSILLPPSHLPPLPSCPPVSAAVGGPRRRGVPPDRWIGPGAVHAEPSGARRSAQRRGRRLLGRPELAGKELDDGHPRLVRLQRRQLRVTTCGNKQHKGCFVGICTARGLHVTPTRNGYRYGTTCGTTPVHDLVWVCSSPIQVIIFSPT